MKGMINTEQINLTKEYRKTAKNLLTSVSRLTTKAGRTFDPAERYELYLEAIKVSNEAYTLLGKAKKLTGKHVSAKKDKLEIKKS